MRKAVQSRWCKAGGVKPGEARAVITVQEAMLGPWSALRTGAGHPQRVASTRPEVACARTGSAHQRASIPRNRPGS